MRDVSAPAEVAWPEPPVRLRVVVLVTLFVGMSLWLYPRGVAAWQVHSQATALADYGACMAGPTGPGLLRGGGMVEFDRLVRRRLLSSAPEDMPFAKCAGLSQSLGGTAESEPAHRAKAREFREYGLNQKEALSLAVLKVNPEPIFERARQAWPFVRHGLTQLVQPSIAVKEAVHPVAPAKPTLGRGLPGSRSLYRSVQKTDDGLLLAHGKGSRLSAHKSTDGGVNWKAWPTSAAESFSERCATGEAGRGFVFANSLEGTMSVMSVVPDHNPVVSPLAPESSQILAAACDAAALAVLVKPARTATQELWLCEFEQRCTKIPSPSLTGANPLEYATDVARVAGATVVAFEMGGIVRVASSRDAGKTWTPLTVAYDDAEYPELTAQVRKPTRFLSVGKHLFLYGAAVKASQSYSLLVSDDQGASFRAP